MTTSGPSEVRPELAVYESALPRLLPQHEGEYVVIKGETLMHYFKRYDEALEWAYETFGLDQFFVKRVTPAAVPNGGADPAAVNVALACATGGSTIRYTLDGSAPTPAHGTVYAGAFDIVASATLKAIAYKAGMADSLVLTTAPYVIG